MSMWTLLGTGAFFSGVSLFYLVMNRTRKRRMEEFEATQRNA